MRQATVIGIAPNDFWDMTPRWCLSLVEAHHEARMLAMRFEVAKAWLTAAWPRMKRMPTLAQALNQLGIGDPEPRAQTDDEMFAAAQRWAGQVAKAAHANGATPKPTKRARLPSLDRWRAAQGKAAGEQ